MKDRTRTYRYSGAVKCRRNKRHWPADNGRSCQQTKRWQAPESPAPQTQRRRRSTVYVTAQLQVHLDLVADCCRKFTTSSTSTRSPETLLSNNSEPVPKHVESTRKILFCAIGYTMLNRATRNTCSRIAISNTRNKDCPTARREDD